LPQKRTKRTDFGKKREDVFVERGGGEGKKEGALGMGGAIKRAARRKKGSDREGKKKEDLARGMKVGNKGKKGGSVKKKKRQKGVSRKKKKRWFSEKPPGQTRQ